MVNLRLALESSAWKWRMLLLLISLARANLVAKFDVNEEDKYFFQGRSSKYLWTTVRQATSGVGRAPLSVENLHSFLYLLPHRKIAAHSGFLKTLSTHFSKDFDVCMFWLHLILYSVLPRLPSCPHSPSPRKTKQSKTRQKTMSYSFMPLSWRAAVGTMFSNHNLHGYFHGSHRKRPFSSSSVCRGSEKWSRAWPWFHLWILKVFNY